MYFGDHPFKAGGRWGFHFDGQMRVKGVGEARRQLLLRPGVNYDVSPNVQFSVGYAYIDTWAVAPRPEEGARPENRLWQQFILRQKLGASSLQHRYRFEQRWVGANVPDVGGGGFETEYSYRNRFRYFLKGTVPLGDPGTSRNYLALYNELMIGFGSNVSSLFDQNRSYAALGFRLGKVNLEAGYLLQIVQQAGGNLIEYNHVLQLAIFSGVPFSE